MDEIGELIDAVRALIDSADTEGCTEDLTVVDSGAVEMLRDLIAYR